MVHERDDRVIPLGQLAPLHERIDRSQLYFFVRCGRWVQVEHTVAFNRLAADFFG